MDTRSEIRDFLTSRRAKLTPEQVGLPDYGTQRVPGLRREEVAVSAGVSVPYYIRLERGDMHGVSESVLSALARALQLDDAERAHLFDLARATQPSVATRRRRPSRRRVREHITGIKHFHHPVVGDLDLTYDRLDLVADPGLTVFAFTAEPGSRHAEALQRLAGWTAESVPA